jgi:tetratricopeptide (TPR) repeat protein
MFVLAVLIAAQSVTPQSTTGPTPELRARLARCLRLAGSDAAAAETEAAKWRTSGGSYFARQCLGVAYSVQERWEAAATTFEDAARDAEAAKDAHSADLWAQAGNAWLAAGNYAKAHADLNAAIGSGTLTGTALGEAYLDRARARVAEGSLEDARSDLDLATANVPADPLAWLLSATLARRMNDMPRAEQDIDEALRRSPDDASVQLEAGNIAALRRDEPGARAAWSRAIDLAPGSPQAEAARKALEQFGAEH